MKNTKYLNIIGGPGCGKTTFASMLFSRMKIEGILCEFVPEAIRELLLKKDYDLINDQYYVSLVQYRNLMNLKGSYDYVITDAPVFMGLVYNRNNRNNINNIQKTHQYFLERMREFDNINIFLTRKDYNYTKDWRMHTLGEALAVDNEISLLFQETGEQYLIDPTIDEILEMCK